MSALQDSVDQSVRRMDCILRELGLETSQGQLDFSSLWSSLVREVSDPGLRETLRTGLQDCQRSVQCLHQTEQQSTRLQVKKSLDFLKCFETKKTEACVKKNIKRKLLQKLRCWMNYLEP